MDATEVDAVMSLLLTRHGTSCVAREEIRVWKRSGVERLHLADGTSVVFKYAEGPFADEHVALGIAQDAGLPVPGRLATVRTSNVLGMLLRDLGPAVRDATNEEGAALAGAVHGVSDTGTLRTIDGSYLAALPRRMINQLDRLPVEGEALQLADGIEKIAGERSEGATPGPVRVVPLRVAPHFHPHRRVRCPPLGSRPSISRTWPARPRLVARNDHRARPRSPQGIH